MVESSMLFVCSCEGPGQESCLSASPAWGRLSQMDLEMGKERPGSLGRSASGCGGRGCLPVMSHAAALQDAAECGSRGDAELS